MDATEILGGLRPLVLVVDAAGTMLDARGGAGGFLGHVPADLVGQPVFDLVAPEALADVVGYFARLTGEPSHPKLLPMPFRSVASATDGRPHGVDVMPTGVVDEAGARTWVVLLIPHSLQTTVSGPLDAELSDAGRDEVRSRLCDELCYSNERGALRWYFVDLVDGRRVFGPSDDVELVPALQKLVDTGWAPWDVPSLPIDEPVRPRSVDDVLVPSRPPERLASAACEHCEPGQHFRLGYVPVELDGELIGVYLELRWVPEEGELAVRANVAGRIHDLCRVTALLLERWRDRDRLVLAATRDSLTGLANRDAFTDALAAASDPSAVLYVDVDRFKSVNDRLGHAAGDRVLVEIGRRIVAVCRPGDVVARFGGDEFVVLLDGVDLAAAEAIGERIVEAVSAPLFVNGAPEHVSSSVGVATCVPGTDPVDLADRAMLVAKRSGRARVVVA
ncbi:MAG: sensor domain-containing diguanylate cyclase [Ilumatobacter sp.]|nr:sensor domain-containing diguanylate cyclase [Ilumatobacter sp.]